MINNITNPNTKNDSINLIINQIPNELISKKQWIVWKIEKDGDKDVKRPYQAMMPSQKARVNDPNTWSSFKPAIKAIINKQANGIGFVFTKDDPYCFIDLDHCINERGEIEPKAKRIIDMLNSYTEISQSGRGIHIIVKAKILDGLGNRSENFEIYDHGRFCAMTFNVLDGYPNTIEERQEQVDAICKEIFKPKPDPEPAKQSSNEMSDHEIIEKLRNSKQGDKFSKLFFTGDISGYKSESEADLALVNMIAFYTQDQKQIKRIIEASALYDEKWERPDYANRTIQKALANITETYKSKEPEQSEFEKHNIEHSIQLSPKSAKELLKLDLPEIRWIVPNIIPEGLTLLCGKPKTGKSWLALGLAVAVASGGKAFGEIDLSEQKGKVLYLALEDNERRLKKRLAKLCISGDFPENLFFLTEIKRGTEGVKGIQAWLEKNTDTKLIIIDTLVSFRRKPSQAINEYDRDSNDMEMIQRLASDYSIGIILIHHLRKAIAEDEFDTISGTLGLSGKADTNLILQRVRGSSEAVLKGTGRDLEEDINIALRFDASIASWIIVSRDANEYKMTQNQAEIYKVLQGKKEGLSISEIAELIGGKQENIRQTLYRMRENGSVVFFKHKYYLKNFVL